MNHRHAYYCLGYHRKTMVSSPSVTIGIPTYNRSQYLDLTLQSLHKLVIPANIACEILVVDNNCTDNTIDVVEKHKAHFGGRLRYVNESKQGLSHCRNRILRESTATVVAYLDDDVKVDPDWLVGLIDAYRQWPNAASIGGKSYLIFTAPRPDWLGSNEARKLSEINLGEQMRETQDGETLFGLNWSVNRNFALRVGEHCADLDRRDSVLLGGGEQEFQFRLKEAGGKIYYTPHMVIGHYVPPERLRKSWFLRRIYWGSRSSVRTRLKVSQPRQIAYRSLLWSVSRSTLALVLHTMVNGFSSPQVFAHAKAIAKASGLFIESFYQQLRSFTVRDRDVTSNISDTGD